MPGELIVVRGVIGHGVECRSLLSDDGERFSLVGDLDDVADGTRIEVTGSIAEVSFCMAGRTIAVASHRPVSEPSVDAADGYRLVPSIAEFQVQPWRFPNMFSLQVLGQVPTLGWSGARLRLIAEEQPSDGLYRFAFEAKSPDGAAGDVVQPIGASWGPEVIAAPGIRVEAIIVHSATNARRWSVHGANALSLGEGGQMLAGFPRGMVPPDFDGPVVPPDTPPFPRPPAIRPSAAALATDQSRDGSDRPVSRS